MYCSLADVKDELYLPLLQQMRVRFPGDELDVFLEKHVLSATDYVDSILSQAFSVPIELDEDGKAPSSVRTATAKMAAFFALAIFSEQEELFKDRRDAAREMLDALVASGRLPGRDVLGVRRIQWGSDARRFTKDVMSRW